MWIGILKTITVVAGLVFIFANTSYYSIRDSIDFRTSSERLSQINHEAGEIGVELKALTNNIKSELDEFNSIQTKKTELVNQADKIALKQAALIGEADANTSLGGLIGKFGRSVFDTFTYGVFADEGVMTESKRFERWIEKLCVSDALNNEQLRQIRRDFGQLQNREDRLRDKIRPVIEEATPLVNRLNALDAESSKLHLSFDPIFQRLQSLEAKRGNALALASVGMIILLFVTRRNKVPPKIEVNSPRNPRGD